MRTVQEFMNEELPQEFHEDFKREFFRWSNETTTVGLFYTDDVLWMCTDYAGIPRCIKCNKVIFGDGHFPDAGGWSEGDMEYCADCLFEKYFSGERG